MKRCGTCKREKPDSAFGKSSRHGLQINCKICHTNYRFLRVYGITLDEYERLLVNQQGVCAICKQPEARKYRGKVCRLAVDHNRETGQVRGLLCTLCNRALGGFQHDPERLIAASIYLQLTESNFVEVLL